MKIQTNELLIYVLIFVLIVFFGVKQISPVSEQLSASNAKKMEKEAAVEELKTKVSSIDIAKSQMSQQREILKPFYKPETDISDSIAAFGGMFEDIVDYIRVNQLLLRSIKYNINPQADPVFNKFSQNYNVCEIQLYVIGTYTQIRNFIQTVFAYPYYINISSIEINPYEQNKKFLLANISINLYSEKIRGSKPPLEEQQAAAANGEATMPPTAAPQPK